MVVFNVKTKAEAAKKLAQVKQEFMNQSSNLNRRRIIPALLCLEDAVYNIAIDILAAHRVDNHFEESPELYSSFIEFLVQWYFVSDEIISSVLKNGFDDPTTKIELPRITFGIYTDKIPDECLEQGFQQNITSEIKKGRIPVNSMLFLKRKADFLPGQEKAVGYYYAIINSDASKHIIASMNLVVKLRDLYVQESWLRAMIYDFPAGVEAEFNELGPVKIVYPKDFNYEEFSNEKGLSPRFLDTNFGVAEWNSNLREVSSNNLKLHKPKGLKNLSELRAEWQEINNACLKMKGFPAIFKKTYGLPLEVFNEILIELITKCYNSNGHMVGLWSISDLINDKRLTKFSSQDIKQVINLLSRNGIRKMKSPFILSIDNMILTNFSRLQEAHLSFPQYCFDDFYEDGLKGPVFEEACRRVLRDKGISTVPNCIKINEPMISENVSQEIGIKYKLNTDLDVVASHGNFLLLIECKEIKSIVPREYELNRFEKYIKEMFWRAKWVSSNLERLKNHVGDAWASLHIDLKQPVTIIPLVVSNNVVDVEIESYPPLITANELKDVLSMEIFVKPKGEMGNLSFRVGSKDVSLIYVQKPEFIV